MLTFDDFTPGRELGEASLLLDRGLLDLWLRLFPDDVGRLPAMPAGMVSAVVMRAYMGVVAPRPPGNIHAGQRVELHALPEIGARVVTRIACADKELRRGRRWLHLRHDSRDGTGRPLFSGRMSLIWAA